MNLKEEKAALKAAEILELCGYTFSNPNHSNAKPDADTDKQGNRYDNIRRIIRTGKKYYETYASEIPI